MPTDRLARIDHLRHLLRHVDLQGPPLHETMLPALAALFDVEVATYLRPNRGESGWFLDFLHTFGLDARQQSIFDSVIHNPDWSWTPFFPPTVDLQNAVIRPMETHRQAGMPPGNIAAAANAEIGFQDDMGTIVTEGPVLLAYLGLVHCGRRHFDAVDESLLRDVQADLQRRLFFEYRLHRMQERAAAFEAAFEAIPSPAYLMRGQHVTHANDAGKVLLDLHKSDVEDELRATSTVPETPQFRATAIEGEGLPDLRLAVRRAQTPDLAVRLATAKRAWSLTERQLDVLELLGWGESNKGIAAQLGCAESTVEFHVTALLRQSHSENRAMLVARLWTGR